jgi:hypothetical protein
MMTRRKLLSYYELDVLPGIFMRTPEVAIGKSRNIGLQSWNASFFRRNLIMETNASPVDPENRPKNFKFLKDCLKGWAGDWWKNDAKPRRVIAGIVFVIFLQALFMVFASRPTNQQPKSGGADLEMNDMLFSIQSGLRELDEKATKANGSRFLSRSFEVELNFIVKRTATPEGKSVYRPMVIDTVADHAKERVQRLKIWFESRPEPIALTKTKGLDVPLFFMDNSDDSELFLFDDSGFF